MTYLLLILFLPLFNFVLGLSLGKKISFLGEITTLTTLITFVLACLVWGEVGKNGNEISASFTWFSFHAANKTINLTGGFWIDKMAALMLVLVTGISTLVHLFSTEYIKGEKYEFRYWGLLGLFCFSMLGIVMSSSLLFIFIFWELVGVSSYFLIGFWFHKDAAARASQKAFLLNRIGDVGFLSGILLLFAFFGTTDLPQIHALIASGTTPSPSELTLIGLLIFCGCIGKSAQFPLQVWLPDAMEGPTPVSSLIHAATMVAAGVYLVPRTIDFMTADTNLVIACIGGITAITSAIAALSQWDIKRVLAYSTLSQLGFMMMGMGTGHYDAAFFHLITHAFFKCALFLCAAIIIHSIAHETEKQGLPQSPQDMRFMGGLRYAMPKTFWVYMICIAALAGVPFFSGFLSKEGIISALIEKGYAENSLFFYSLAGIAFLTSFLTAFYATRQAVLVFFGENRLRSEKPLHFHDAGWRMLLPVSILAILSLFTFYSWNPFAVNGVWWEFGEKQAQNLHLLPHSWNIGILLTSLVCVAAGIGLSYFKYRHFSLADGHKRHSVFDYMAYNDFYQNAFFESIARLFLRFTRLLHSFDHEVIDGAVSGVAEGLVNTEAIILPQKETLTVPKKATFFKSISFHHFYQNHFFEGLANTFLGIARILATFDKKMVDGFVNGFVKFVVHPQSQNHPPSLALMMLDEAIIDRNQEKEHVSLSILMAKFDKHIIDGLVNRVATTFRTIGTRFKNLQGNEVQRYLLLAIGVLILIIGGISFWIYKHPKSPVQTAPSNANQILATNEIYAITRLLSASDSVKHLPINTLVENLFAKQENLTEDSLLLSTISHQIDSLSAGKFRLNKEDFAFFATQYANSQDFRLVKDSLATIHLIPSSEIEKIENQANTEKEDVHKAWDNFFKIHGEKGFYYYLSLPYISVNQQIAIVSVRMKCGAFCGGGHKAILVKEEGKWRLLTKMYKWSS